MGGGGGGRFFISENRGRGGLSEEAGVQVPRGCL